MPNLKSFEITKEKLFTITKGACIMASGGGGSYQIAKYTVEKEFAKDDKLNCVPCNSIKDNSFLAGAACMFPPSILTKNTDTISPLVNSYNALEKWCKNSVKKRFKTFKKFKYFHPLEVGAINTIVPIIAMVKKNKQTNSSITILDADTAGRAIPTLPLIVFEAYKSKKISWFPNYVTSIINTGNKYYTGQFSLANPHDLENAFITLIMKEFHGVGGFSLFPMDGKTLKNNPSVNGTLSDALNVGKIYDNKNYTQKQKAKKIVKYFNKRDRKSKIIFNGIIKKISTTQDGTDNGSIIVEGIGKNNGYIFEIKVSNENILAYKYKTKIDLQKPYILGPDSISYVPLSKDIDVFDNSDLNNYLNCPKSPQIKVCILGISAPKVVSSKQTLIDEWSKEWASFGYHSNKYIQPWLSK